MGKDKKDKKDAVGDVQQVGIWLLLQLSLLCRTGCDSIDCQRLQVAVSKAELMPVSRCMYMSYQVTDFLIKPDKSAPGTWDAS